MRKPKFSRFGFRPLAINGDEIFGYEAGWLISVDFRLNQQQRFVRAWSESRLHGVVARSRFFERVLRLGPSAAIFWNNQLFVAHRENIIRYDLLSRKVYLDFVVPSGRGVLSFSTVHINGEEWLVFGEYFANPHREAVSIWGKSLATGRWSTFAGFPAGEIEHVHAVQEIRGEILVLTGDFDVAAGIWALNSSTRLLHPLIRGDQRIRSCYMHDLMSAIFFATDTQLEENYLQILQKDEFRVSVKQIFKIPGSSIYSCSDGHNMTFSTAVEPGPSSSGFVLGMFDTKPGPGILGDESWIFTASSDGTIKTVFSARKDWIPMRLGQFGTFVFPSGTVPRGVIIAFGQAVRTWDGCCLVFEVDG